MTEGQTSAMTEWDKMLSGQQYCSTDADLIAKRTRGKQLCDAWNALDAADTAGREAALSALLGSCGRRVWMLSPFYCTYGCNIAIGDDTFVNMNCTFLDSGRITIGNRCLIGPDVKIYTSSHPVQPVRHTQDADGSLRIVNFTLPVSIGNNVWIGGGAILCPGVSIGDNSVIAAGSVVNRSIPANVLAAGNPCRVKRKLDAKRDTQYI